MTLLLHCREADLSPDALIRHESWMSQERNHLLLQIFWIYLTRWEDIPAAYEALRLIWNSIPHPYISSAEIEKAYTGVLSSEEIKDIYEFYVEAVGEGTSEVQSRSLKHYCRTTMLSILWQSNQWLPEGIQQIGLPNKLQAYLKLKKAFKRKLEGNCTAHVFVNKRFHLGF
ncbi:hypothetical protein AVEN_275561-1 [Araneus ventricosus]|uniref:SOCS box domain-containing protein n=1 Tax=Araneus ventricosus TaxID=182803 RepID=A0A4Y2KSD4_ARAVE|nr:hypothetical protein AVEN_275561-1 [Araneus ventricosus]